MRKRKPTPKAWQLPFSATDSKSVAHWFTVSDRKHILSRAACGRRFNPGFATPAKSDTLKCTYCKALR